MAGDYTRFRYNPLKDTTGLLMQQGRVLLDQDLNEYVHAQDRRWRAETMDTMGRAVVPIDTKNAFQLTIAGTSFTIGVGRMYVDGLTAENHGVDPTDPSKRFYDPILGELVGTSATPYEQQPYYPNPPAFPTDGQPHLVYLDVWEREVTYLEEPKLIDQAVAVDTATRIQTVWQVKFLTDTPADSTCSTAPGTIPGWVAATAPSAGRLTTAAAGVPSSTDPCIVPPNGGYRGSGNRSYRVEIDTGGPLGTAQFKWSRDNASVASPVTSINATLDTLNVVLTRRDSVLRFQPNDWVEITDDFRYFHGLSGEMRQVAAVDDVDLTIRLKTALPAGEFDATNASRHTRVVRWDQQGIVRDTLGNPFVDVDTNGGLIPVPAAGTTLALEDGIQITFSIDGAMPVANFNIMDFWMFAARVIDASVDILTQEPPRGILHHYAWLGFVTLPGGPATDCRVFWPPSMGDEGCDCSVCVTADSHNNNILTIQAAISQVEGKGGGKVCLGPGIYNITSTITVSGSSAIEISGHGLPNLVAATGFSTQTPMLLIDSTVATIVEDLGFVGPAAGPNQPPVPGIVISNSAFVTIQRCLFVSQPSRPPGLSALSPAIGIAGFTAYAMIHDNVFDNVAVGIGPSPINNAVAPFLAECSIRENEMICTQAAFQFTDPKNVASFTDVSFTGNSVYSLVGFAFQGDGLGVSVENNSFVVEPAPSNYSVAITTVGVSLGASESRICNNRITGNTTTPGDTGIILSGRVVATIQVTGNQISGLAGNGIVITTGTLVQGAIISRNQIGSLGGIGIMSDTSSKNLDLDLDGNIITSVGLGTPAADATQCGILLQGASMNLRITNNAVETVAQGAQANARAGIYVTIVSGILVSGNRVLDVGPAGPVTLGGGVLVVVAAGRLEVVNNEVRRAVTPPASGDASPFGALLVAYAVDANIRGNVLESFGNLPAVLVAGARSCVFSDNQCFLDNPAAAKLATVVVELGSNETLTAGAIIASGNYVQTLATFPGALTTVMALNPANPRTATVLGNIANGNITVSGAPLAAPWAPLNAIGV